MRPFTLKTLIVAKDKASKQLDKITKSSVRMTKSITRESKIAGRAFASFSRSVNRSTKRALVSINNFNGRINRFGRNVSKKLGFLGKLGIGIGISASLTFMGNAVVSLETNLASLSAITGITGSQFKDFEKEIDAVSKSEKIFAADTAKAFELVGSAKPELLSSAKALGQVSKSAITLSKASGDELADNVGALTNVLNQFDLAANQSSRAMNVLAAASVVGDTKIAQTSQAFKAAGSEAKLSGLNIEELSGAVATFSKFGFKGAEAGTKFRNILSKMSLGDALPKDALTRLKAAGVDIDLISDNTIPFIDRLKELSKIQKNSAALAKTFGAENKGAAAILLNNLPLLEQNIKGVTGTSAATDQAAIKTNTLAVKWQEMTAVFKNAITSTNSENKSLSFLKDIIGFVTDNMNVIIPVIGSLITAFVAFKVVMAAVNLVMLASPITWIVLGIVALIAAVVLLIAYWDKVKIALINFWNIIKENPIAKFLLAPIFDTIDAIKLMIDGIKGIANFFGSSTDINVGQKFQKTRKMEIRQPKEIAKKVNIDAKLLEATNKNTDELNKNTNSTKAQWKGKFFTSVLKDANVADRTIGREVKNSTIQKELAMTVMDNEVRNSSIQNEIVSNTGTLPTDVVTQANSRQRTTKSNNQNINGNININVVDKTGGNFSVEVESTGVETTTTGNS